MFLFLKSPLDQDEVTFHGQSTTASDVNQSSRRADANSIHANSGAVLLKNSDHEINRAGSIITFDFNHGHDVILGKGDAGVKLDKGGGGSVLGTSDNPIQTYTEGTVDRGTTDRGTTDIYVSLDSFSGSEDTEI